MICKLVGTTPRPSYFITPDNTHSRL